MPPPCAGSAAGRHLADRAAGWLSGNVAASWTNGAIASFDGIGSKVTVHHTRVTAAGVVFNAEGYSLLGDGSVTLVPAARDTAGRRHAAGDRGQSRQNQADRQLRQSPPGPCSSTARSPSPADPRRSTALPPPVCQRRPRGQHPTQQTRASRALRPTPDASNFTDIIKLRGSDWAIRLVAATD